MTPAAIERMRRDEAQAVGAVPCRSCGRHKPPGQFVRRGDGSPPRLCRTCQRLRCGLWRETAAYRLWRDDPKTRAHNAEACRRYRRSDRGRAWEQAYRQSPLGRLRNRRKAARQRLAKIPASEVERRRGILATIAEYDRRIVRLQGEV